MTRDSIPRDDLYGELEVSRQASVAAIEAAYRRLVKQHHPDVARSDDVERIKRLNLAREWLTDLDRRRRYDVSRGLSPTSAVAHHSPNGDDAPSGTRRRPGTPAAPAPEASSEPARSFGVNANEVRIFLASLRGLDSDRARRVFDGRAVAHAKGYTAARRAAAQIGQSKRKTEWQLAREAASVIARGKLGDTTLTEQVVDVLADIAGAIAIRDLLTKADYKTVLLPWTWRSARVVPAKAAAPAAKATKPVRAPAVADKQAVPATSARTAVPAAAPASVTTATPSVAAAPPMEQPARRVSISDLGASPWQAPPEPSPPPRKPAAARALPLPAVSIPAASIPRVSVPSVRPPRVRVPSWLPAAIAIAVFVVVAGALLGIGRSPSDQQVAGVTDAPMSRPGGATAVVVPPGESIAGSTDEPGSSDPGGETPGPGATEPPGGGGGPTAAPNPTNAGPTPRPTRAPTAPPTPTPTPAPTPAPTPPPPTPTPGPDCLVPNFIHTQASNADQKWANAGFTGPLTLDPPIPPNYQIQWQSIPAGTMSPCTSGITLRAAAL